jgi:hypothetical protein
MESRPEHRMVRRMMWEAAALGPAADDPEPDSPPAVPPAALPPEPIAPEPSPPPPSPRRDVVGAVPGGRGPGSQIRRYVHRPQQGSTKRPPPSPIPPIKPQD